MRLVRVCTASVVFASFVLLFLDFAGLFDKCLGWLPKFQFWPAVLSVNVAILVLLIALTMIFGRVYCSFLCPLGIMQDGIYRIRISGKKKRRFAQHYSPALNWLRYTILGIFIVLVILGFGATAYLIEPYSIFGRMITSLTGKSLVIGLISAGTFAAIFTLVWLGGRTWCNTICPVGTILGILSAKSLFRPVINEDKCNGCGLCAKGCRASCIDPVAHKVDMSRCVDCFDCIDNCSGSAIEYKFSLDSLRGKKTAPKPAASENSAEDRNGSQPADQSRRAFMTAAALAAGSAVLKAQEEGHGFLLPLPERKSPERETRVVPAGSVSLQNFDSHCVGCQLCVEACPNKVLTPDMNPERFMQPKMDFEKGFCRPECNACSRVCPAGAIRKVTTEEKTAISIGHAVYNPDTCVVMTDGVDCGNCARHCPAGAISMVKSDKADGRRIPAVNPERCIGCGRCEYVCPSRPVSAIYVEGNLVHRSI